MKKLTAIMPIVTLLLGVNVASVQAAPLNSTSSTPEISAMCQDLPKSEPWDNHPTHIWNVVWRNKVALCATQTKPGSLESSKVQPVAPQASQPVAPQASQPVAPQASQPVAPTMPIAQETEQPIAQNP